MKKKEPELITKAEFARRVGVSKMAVSKFTSDLVMVGSKVAYEESLKVWNSKPRRIAAKGAEQRVEMAQALLKIQIEKAQVDVDRKKMQLSVERGKLIDADEAKAQAFEFARRLRDQILAAPKKTAPLICSKIGVNISQAREIESIISDHLRSALDKLADQLKEKHERTRSE